MREKLQKCNIIRQIFNNMLLNREKIREITLDIKKNE